MKKFYSLAVILCMAAPQLVFAQVGIGITTPATTSILDLTSTSKGFLVPRMTASQKTAISSPATGLLIYQTDGTDGFYYYTGSAWISLISSSVAVTDCDGLSDAKIGGTNFTGSLLLGHQTTGSLSSAEYNTGLGLSTLQAITTGDNNTASGVEGLYANTTGYGNTASGYKALRTNTTGNDNTANGNMALYSNTSGAYNVANGIEALYTNTTGIANVAIGPWASGYNINGAYNVAIGSDALRYNKAGSNATAIGYGAMCFAYNNTTPFDNCNVAVGYNALRGSTSNSANSGNYNTGVGYEAIKNFTSGSSNTAIGYQAGNVTTSGSNNTSIGNGANPSSAAASNRITLGNASVSQLNCQVTSITALSDRRDKSEIKNISEGLDFVKKLNPVTFTWNTRDKAKVGIKSAGFIAQDLLDLQNNSKIGENLDLVSSDNPEKLEARYSNLLPVLVKAIQELSVQNEAQQKEIEKLKIVVDKKNL